MIRMTPIQVNGQWHHSFRPAVARSDVTGQRMRQQVHCKHAIARSSMSKQFHEQGPDLSDRNARWSFF